MVENSKQFDIGYVPNKDVLSGIMVVFDSETKYETRYAYADIKQGQRYYSFPIDARRIAGIYIKLNV